MKNKLSILICLLAVASQAWSYDFSAKSNGQTLYYNIIKGTRSVELTNSDPENMSDGKIHVKFYIGESQNKKMLQKKDTIVKYTGDVVIPETVRYWGKKYKVIRIGNSAFYECKNLTSISIPNSVRSIGKFTFDDCINLKSILIPNSVTSIGFGAFQGAGLTSVTLPNRIKKIEGFTFSGCSLTSVTIPNSVKSIEEYAFAANNELTEVDIPNSVTTIKECVFNNCTVIENITIPASVKKLGERTFGCCWKLKEITLQSTKPIKMKYNLFISDKFFSSVSLIVPKGSIEKYKEAEGWKDFASISEY